MRKNGARKVLEKMAYSDFNLTTVTTRFGLTITDRAAFFDSIAEVEPLALLREFLSRNVPLATAIHTEKARSELIVAPLLVDLVERFKGRISFFSGVELNANPENGLNGVCDFILARSPVQHILRRPVAIIVEAKQDCIPDGLGQCVAAMLGAKLLERKRMSTASTSSRSTSSRRGHDRNSLEVSSTPRRNDLDRHA